jgi:hypothetical protein
MSIPSPHRYQIVVKEEISPDSLIDLHEMQITCLPNGCSALVGTLSDQAELLGMLDRLVLYGLTLVSLQEIESGSPDT